MNKNLESDELEKDVEAQAVETEIAGDEAIRSNPSESTETVIEESTAEAEAVEAVEISSELSEALPAELAKDVAVQTVETETAAGDEATRSNPSESTETVIEESTAEAEAVEAVEISSELSEALPAELAKDVAAQTVETETAAGDEATRSNPSESTETVIEESTAEAEAVEAVEISSELSEALPAELAKEVEAQTVETEETGDDQPASIEVETVEEESTSNVEAAVSEPSAVPTEPSKPATVHAEPSKPKVDVDTLTKNEIVMQLKNLKAQAKVPSRQDVDALRRAFYNIRQTEQDEERGKFDENGEEGEVFTPSVDPLEDVLKVYLNDIKDKRAQKLVEEEHVKENNYKVKLEIIESIKALTESTDDFNKLFNQFKDLQQKWNFIKMVPQSKVRDLWTDYQIHSEKFYDLVKINNELRDYDFKKNLELKTEICEAAEKLNEDVDPVSAFHQLQNFHQQWREIGPVERAIREELWERFKDASTLVNKNYQVYFESLKGLEEDNLSEKQAIIDQLKLIDYLKIKSYRDWDAKTKEVITLQTKWRTIGFVPRKVNSEIFQEFRELCDTFFENKSTFFKAQRAHMDENLVKKRALTDRALALKDSTDWNKTTQELIQIQKKWKEIGPVPRKFSDAIWKEFVDACDHFFEQKKKIFSSQKGVEVENYKAKKELVEQIKNLDQSLETSKLLAEIKDLQDKWHAIGFVPYKDKDKSYKELYAVVDAHYDRLKIDKDERRFAEFKSNVEGRMASKDNPERALSKERNHLTFQYNKLKSDLQTYQNNMSFLTLSSKGKENPLLKDVNKKIESLKNEMELIEKKVETLDSNLRELE